MIFLDWMKNRKNKEPEKNPFLKCDKIIIKKDIEHQNIGGRTAYIEREVNIDKILDLLISYNIAAVNFANRRPDLFRDVNDSSIPDEKLAKRKAKSKNIKYYYVKIWQGDEINGCYLGYFIASDEYDKYIPYEEKKEVKTK